MTIKNFLLSFQKKIVEKTVLLHVVWNLSTIKIFLILTKKGKYEWYEHDLMTYFDDLKYEECVRDTDKYFQDVQLVNYKSGE